MARDIVQELLYWSVWAALAPAIHGALTRWPVHTRGSWVLTLRSGAKLISSRYQASALRAMLGPLR